MKNYKNNLELLSKNHVYSHEMEHDACGVGLIASTEEKKQERLLNMELRLLKLFGIVELLMQMEKREMEQGYI